MFDFLKSRRSTKPAEVAPSSVSPNSSNSVNHSSDVRRELIRVVLKDTLRQHGIPLDWLACEVILIPRALDKEELYIQLVLMKWNEQLLRYATALQQQLLAGLDRFDPEVDHSKYIVSWRFSPNCGSPFMFMPEPKFWLQSAPPKVPETPVSVLDRRRARRPAKAAPAKPAPAVHNSTAESYEPTQIAPLG
jgi:hypothetical protein